MTAGELQRFENSYIPEPVNGCWIWLKHRNRQTGYGCFALSRKYTSSTGKTHTAMDSAHRVAYEHWRGQIPSGLEIDHLCRNRWCVNPDHLEAVTDAVNVLRGEGCYAQNARKTHCKRGHEFTAENTYLIKGGAGGRMCRTCHKAQMKVINARRYRGKEQI